MLLKKHNINIALLFIWSAMLLYGCNGDSIPLINFDPENTPSIVVDSLKLKYSENGTLSYEFDTPQMKRYHKVDSTYMIFEKGVKITTYSMVDSVLIEESVLTAKYAYYDERAQKWEVRGDVQSTMKDGKQLFTEQLFWDQQNHFIHSFVKTTIVDGTEKIIGLEGFTSDEDMNDIKFRNTQGRFLIDTAKNVVDTLGTNTAIEKNEHSVKSDLPAGQ